MYDRFNKLGVSVCYKSTLEVQKHISGHYDDKVIQAARSGKRIKFIGDNLQFMERVHTETIKNHAHMVHMFASVVLIHDWHFMDMPDIPEIPINDLNLNHVLPSKDDLEIVKGYAAQLLADVIKDNIPSLREYMKYVHINEEDIPFTKTDCVTLPVLPYNEQYYQQVVKILEEWQKLAEKIMREFPNCMQRSFPAGGDQLTRERLVGALLLRFGNIQARDRFDLIGTITFEFFHLAMNFMEKAVIKPHWSVNNPQVCAMLNW